MAPPDFYSCMDFNKELEASTLEDLQIWCTIENVPFSKTATIRQMKQLVRNIVAEKEREIARNASQMTRLQSVATATSSCPPDGLAKSMPALPQGRSTIFASTPANNASTALLDPNLSPIQAQNENFGDFDPTVRLNTMELDQVLSNTLHQMEQNKNLNNTNPNLGSPNPNLTNASANFQNPNQSSGNLNLNLSNLNPISGNQN